MILPTLKPNKKRVREFNNYKDKVERIIYTYLFEGGSHRDIDIKVLNIDEKFAKGYEAMNVLHHLGIKGDFKGIFKDKSINEGIDTLKAQNSNEYDILINYLYKYNMKIRNDIYYDDKEEPETFVREGKIIYNYSKKYERNMNNRLKSIKYHGTSCVICGFDFGKAYGERGQGFIEIHHLNPLSEVEKEVEINPKKDLVPVCANCHRIIHRERDNILSVEEVREILNKEYIKLKV